MYLERNVFQLRFGMSKPAIELWSQYLKKVHDEDQTIHVRMLTDISGTAYSLIVEQTFNTFAEAEPSSCKLVQRNDWKEFYQQFVPYCESSERNYYKIQLSF